MKLQKDELETTSPGGITLQVLKILCVDEH